MHLLRLILLALICAAAPAKAHLTPNSEINLDMGRDRIEVDLLIPLGELQYAEPAFRGLDAGAPSLTQKRLISDYLKAHIAAHAPDGRPWTIMTGNMRIGGNPRDLEARLTLVPPPGAPARMLSLRYSAVIDRVPNHIALLALKSDFEAGYLAERPELLAGLRQGNMTAMIDRGEGSAWLGFLASIGLGMHHIAEGHDHLLFLVTLLLPAPLFAAGRRWRGYAGWRPTARSLAIVVTAFTAGHSVTLIGGAFFDWQLPAQPVEILIALSILISAVHAWRPIFPGREALVAGGFGLIHGLAFATLIGRVGLDRWQKAQSILGFNLGIELIQLLVLASVMPVLILLARSSFYQWVRPVAAAFAGLAAILWIIERGSGREFGPAQTIDTAIGYAPWLIIPVIGAALFSLIVQRVSSASRTS